MFTVQRGGRRQGVLRHDAQQSAQGYAVRGCLHSGHGSHSQSLETLASNAGSYVLPMFFNLEIYRDARYYQRASKEMIRFVGTRMVRRVDASW